MPDHIDKSELKRQLIATIDRRFRSHAAKDLADYVFSNHLFATAEPALIQFSFAARQEIVHYLSDEIELAGLIQYCCRATKAYTYRRNQFINFNRAYDELLSAEYRDFFLRLRAALVGADSEAALVRTYADVLTRHHERLRLILSTYCLTYGERDLAENPLLRTVPCEEYSARFQLHLLHIDLAGLAEPILDVGCGSAGTLINFLREQGYVAFGLDRLAPAGDWFIQQDWFDFDYGGRAWGTIIAHQTLSTHYIFNYVHNRARAEQYAGLFRQLLFALPINGAFYYAPGLPFFEDTLATLPGYALDRTTISTDQVLGIGEIFYATRIERLVAGAN
jgi:hypothetical protein